MAENANIPTQEEIAVLPHWAQVAFAARCARRVLPLFRHDGPKEPARALPAVMNAVSFAEHAAANAVSSAANAANAVSVNSFAVNAVNIAALNAKNTASAAAQDASHVAFAASAAAKAAAQAATTANAASAAASAAAANRSPEVLAAIRFDFTTLLDRASAEKWTDDTPVPPTVFGPLWPFGVPKDWPQEVAEDRLIATIAPPPDAPPEQIADFQIRLYEMLNKLAVANGGAGLKVDSLGRDVPSLAPVGTGV